MLKLKKIHILGFKSFCDRTELAVPGSGIAVVVGPNGCGKSNILDGVSWVLGEQSAKSLRGTHMQDVIFAGTRERKALGMAEVTLTLVDPEAYEGPIPVEPEIAVEPEGPGEWDEEEMRRQRAVEAEEIIAAEQPGQALDEDDPEAPQEAATTAGPQAVVLKIRRRKFHRTPQKGEIVIYAAAVSDRRKRIPAQRQALPAARHSRHLHGHGLGSGELRHHRPGADWPTAQLEAP